MRELGKAFTVGKFVIGNTFSFIDLEADVGDDVVEISM